MTAIEQAQQLRDQAIAILMAERDRIDAQLAQFGEIKVPVTRRGRPPKQPEISFHSETNQPVLSSPHSDSASNTPGPSPSRRA
jgi:hypothetical protein